MLDKNDPNIKHKLKVANQIADILFEQDTETIYDVLMTLTVSLCSNYNPEVIYAVNFSNKLIENVRKLYGIENEGKSDKG